MTIWPPRTIEGEGPIYRRLADHVEAAISAGSLRPGEKLPPQRDLAYDLGVTIGTVGRAYALARERGLISGEVGRGTYVIKNETTSPRDGASALVSTSLRGTRSLNVSGEALRLDSSAAPGMGQHAEIGQVVSAVARDHPFEVTSYSRTLPSAWLEAGAQWLSSGDWRPNPAQIVPTLGAHPAILAAALAVTQPGDRIATEELSYCSSARALTLSGRRIVNVPLDDDGLVPGELDRLCAQQHPKLLFLMPGMQNPTLAVLSHERRQAIVELARRHDIWLIEDAIYGSLAGDPYPSLAELAPERTFRIDGFSKSVTAGLRGGWIACPPGYAGRVHAAHKLVSGGLSFLLAEASARMVLNGDAFRTRDKVRVDIATRVGIAQDELSGFDLRSHPHCPFIWLAVPAPWHSSTLKRAAEGEGVLIDDEDEFRTSHAANPQERIRIGLTVPKDHAELRRGLALLRSLLEGEAIYDSYS